MCSFLEEEWRTTAGSRCAGVTETCLIKPSDEIKSQSASAPNAANAAECARIAANSYLHGGFCQVSVSIYFKGDREVTKAKGWGWGPASGGTGSIFAFCSDEFVCVLAQISGQFAR